MSNCSNCFNGCAEIVSDRCVRYTGVDVAVLGIKSGDSLSFVEQALITFLTSTLDGTGVKPDISASIICELVKKYLPDCEDLNATNLFTALIKAACDLQVQIDEIVADIAVIEAPYTIGCLTGVTSTSGTHNILQAVITKLCTLETSLAALALNVSTNYVKLADLNTLIQNYLNSISATTQQYTKMVPYTVVEYYGPLSNFNGAGVGLASAGFDKIYICNGQNGTPDKRGRVGVGAIQGVPGGGPLDAAVDPSLTISNPNYALNTKTGANAITLAASQIPSHTHTATSTVIEPNSGQGHRHDFIGVDTVDTAGGSTSTRRCGDFTKQTSYATTGITVNTAIGNTGSGESHANIQPVLACYYIMYIP
jgi:microcystin-dependent protein